MKSVTIERRITVRGGRCDSKAPWVLKQVEDTQSVEFIKLDLKDSGFNRFMTGSRKGWFNIQNMTP